MDIERTDRDFKHLKTAEKYFFHTNKAIHKNYLKKYDIKWMIRYWSGYKIGSWKISKRDKPLAIFENTQKVIPKKKTYI